MPSNASRRTDVTRTSEQCAAPFHPWDSTTDKARFCSRPCLFESMRRRVHLACETCGAAMKRPISQIKNHTFCSFGCFTRWIISRAEDPLTIFWASVAIAEDGCWNWTGAIGAGGYGSFGSGYRIGLPQRAHRASWTIHFGDIPDGIFVCHHCDNPPCVRPSHLFLGTVQDNHADMDAKGRRRRPAVRRTSGGVTHRSSPTPD